jgi:Holliday junction resolvasome RuvABC ATP-dependent DNA helicase subunit
MRGHDKRTRDRTHGRSAAIHEPEERDVLSIDEIHRLNRAVEEVPIPMEDSLPLTS